MTIGIVGCGGLGIMGIKLVKGLGHDVVGISHDETHYNIVQQDLVQRFVNLSSQKSIDFEKGKMDLILNTLPVHHDINPIMTMLKTDGILV